MKLLEIILAAYCLGYPIGTWMQLNKLGCLLTSIGIGALLSLIFNV